MIKASQSQLFEMDVFSSQSDRIGLAQRQEMETKSNGGNYHLALMLIFLLGSAAVALAFVPVLISSPNKPQKISKDARRITQPIHAFGITLMTGLCLYFVIKKKQWKDSGRISFVDRPSRKPSRNSSGTHRSYGSEDTGETDVLDSNANPADSDYAREIPYTQVVVFGVGGAIWLMSNIVFIVDYEDYGIYWNWISLLDISIYLLSVIVQIIFLGKYDGAILPNESIFHYSIALMVADKVWVWLTVTLGDLSDVVLRAGNESAHNESALHKSIEISLLFFEPFFLEFLTVSMGVFFHLWNVIGDNKAATSRPYVETRANWNKRYEDYGHVIDSEENGGESNYSGHDATELGQVNLLDRGDMEITQGLRRNERIQTATFTILLIMVHVGLFIIGLFIYQLEPFLPWTYSLSDNALYLINYGTEIATVLPITIVCIVATYKTYKSSDCLSLAFTTNDYLLFLTAAANFMWYIFRVIAATTVLSLHTDQTNQAVIGLFYSILCIVQIWAQTQMLLAAKSARQTDRSSPKLTRFCLIYVVIINIFKWLSIAISRELLVHVTSFHTIMNECFGDQTTKGLTFLFYPALELYRFHSAVVAYEVLKK